MPEFERRALIEQKVNRKERRRIVARRREAENKYQAFARHMARGGYKTDRHEFEELMP